MRKIAKALALLLAAVMAWGLAGCGRTDGAETGPAPEETSAAGDAAVYALPAGAESEYALYTAVVDYLNGGFHTEALRDVWDLDLTMAFYSKCERDSADIFTLGLQYDETSALIARLREKAAGMDKLVDEYGDIDMDYVDYDALIAEFPEELRSRADPEDHDFENFLENLFYADGLLRDGVNPFGTDQTVWEKLAEGDLEKAEYDDYDDWDRELFLHFPRIYEMGLGTYVSGSAYHMYMRYTEIDGRYYLLDLSCAVSGLGG